MDEKEWMREVGEGKKKFCTIFRMCGVDTASYCFYKALLPLRRYYES